MNFEIEFEPFHVLGQHPVSTSGTDFFLSAPVYWYICSYMAIPTRDSDLKALFW